MLVPLLFGVFFKSVNAEDGWLKGGTAFAGIDRTFNPSPLCGEGGVDNHLTSNIGFTQNIYTKDAATLGFKYTHHSCAISPDKNSYDSGGLYAEWHW